MTKVPYTTGNWKVTRRCCQSRCHECNGNTKHRITHSDNLSQQYAEFVASNWKGYSAVAEPMTK